MARNLGIIQIQPRRGITILPYDFAPAVSKSLYYAINSNIDYFQQYSELRNQLEKAFFIDSTILLTKSDITEIQEIVDTAREKLSGNPIHIPHQEHRTYHMKIYSRTENIFVKGLFNSYWDMYELVGLDHFTDLAYLERVWDFHFQIIDMIAKQNFTYAYQLLEEHIDLIYKRETRT